MCTCRPLKANVGANTADCIRISVINIEANLLLFARQLPFGCLSSLPRERLSATVAGVPVPHKCMIHSPRITVNDADVVLQCVVAPRWSHVRGCILGVESAGSIESASRDVRRTMPPLRKLAGQRSAQTSAYATNTTLTPCRITPFLFSPYLY